MKEAVAEADPVTKLAGLIKQRRRWLNGTFFAMIYTLSNWSRIWTESHHSFWRKTVRAFRPCAAVMRHQACVHVV